MIFVRTVIFFPTVIVSTSLVANRNKSLEAWSLHGKLRHILIRRAGDDSLQNFKCTLLSLKSSKDIGDPYILKTYTFQLGAKQLKLPKTLDTICK